MWTEYPVQAMIALLHVLDIRDNNDETPNINQTIGLVQLVATQTGTNYWCCMIAAY